MSKLHTEYHYGKDVYLDKEEDALLLYYKGEKTFDESELKDTMYFLTTPVRENIISWYPFRGGSVLEIGCGCGCITGALCKKCDKVVSVDQSEQRARITYYRHKDVDNLDIYAGNISDIPFNQQFDYVVVVGVLEYARQFFGDKPEDQKFLKLIRSLLKSDGVLLLAIENRFGIKYFAGALEDHIREQFISIEGYEQRNVQTYGRDELSELLNQTGYSITRFYYPFPDYKLPSVIYSDKRKPTEEEAAQLNDYLYGQSSFFDGAKAKQGLFGENDFISAFSNSFLVEAGNENSAFSDVVYANYHVKRAKTYNVVTILKEDISGNRWYIKKPLSQKSIKHLENYSNIHKKLIKDGYPIHNVDCDSQLCEWKSKEYKGISISKRLRQAWFSNGQQGLLNEIDSIIDFIRRFSVFEELTDPIVQDLLDAYPNGTKVIKYGLMDLNANNIFYDYNEGYILLDQEWECNKQIPVDYAIMCSVGAIYRGSSLVRNCFSIKELLFHYGIDDAKISILSKISDAYFSDYIELDDHLASVFFDQLLLDERNDWKTSISTAYNKAIETLNERDLQLKNLSQNYVRVERLLKERDSQVKTLSENYNNVVQKLEESNCKIKVLSENYNRVEKLLDERNNQVKELSENYNRVEKLLDERNNQVKELSENYYRVENMYEERVKQVKDLLENYNRVTNLLSEKEELVRDLSENYSRVVKLIEGGEKDTNC